MNRQHRDCFGKDDRRATRPLETVHCDLSGPHMESWGGVLKYFVVFLDDFSRRIWVYFTKTRTAKELITTIQMFLNEAHSQTHHRVAHLHRERLCATCVREASAFWVRALWVRLGRGAGASGDGAAAPRGGVGKRGTTRVAAVSCASLLIDPLYNTSFIVALLFICLLSQTMAVLYQVAPNAFGVPCLPGAFSSCLLLGRVVSSPSRDARCSDGTKLRSERNCKANKVLVERRINHLRLLQSMHRVLTRSHLNRSLFQRPTPTRSMSSSSSRTPIPSNLPSLLSTQWDKALQTKSAFFYPSEIHSITDEATSEWPALNWSIRRCEALREKAKEKKRKEQVQEQGKTADEKQQPQAGGEGQNPSDVFAPPYDENLLVNELGDHTLLLNKFALIPHHALLVTRDFKPQTVPPSPTTLALSHQILHALPSSSPQDVLCFFNCGPESGASQPHCHMQFVDLKEGGGVLIENLLDRIEKDGREMETVHALPLPYQHFVHLLPPALSSGSHDEQERILGGLLLKLLDSMFQARSAAIVAQQEIKQTRGTSWNLLLTKRAIHLIPRVMEDFPLGQGIDNEEVGNLSLNALCFAGHLVTKSNEEIGQIKQYPGGIRAILSQVGVKPVSDFTVASTGTEGPPGGQ